MTQGILDFGKLGIIQARAAEGFGLAQSMVSSVWGFPKSRLGCLAGACKMEILVYVYIHVHYIEVLESSSRLSSSRCKRSMRSCTAPGCLGVLRSAKRAQPWWKQR